MANRTTRKIVETVTITGNGSGWYTGKLTKVSRGSTSTLLGNSGRWCGMVARQDAGGGASAADLYGVETNTAPSAGPADETCFYSYTAIPVTASASVAAHKDSNRTIAGCFNADTDKYIAMNVTAAGAFTFKVRVEMEVDC